MNRRAFLLSAAAVPIAAVLPEAPALANPGCAAPGTLWIFPNRTLYCIGSRTIEWSGVGDHTVWWPQE